MVRRWLQGWICQHDALDASLLRELRSTRKEVRVMHSELLEELVALEGLKDSIERQLKRMRSRSAVGTYASESPEPEETPNSALQGKHPKTAIYQRARERRAAS